MPELGGSCPDLLTAKAQEPLCLALVGMSLVLPLFPPSYISGDLLSSFNLTLPSFVSP